MTKIEVNTEKENTGGTTRPPQSVNHTKKPPAKVFEGREEGLKGQNTVLWS